MSNIQFPLISGVYYQPNTEDCKNDEDVNELLSETERLAKKKFAQLNESQKNIH